MCDLGFHCIVKSYRTLDDGLHAPSYYYLLPFFLDRFLDSLCY